MKKAIRILTTVLILSLATALYCIVAAPLLEPVSKYQKVELPHNGSNISTQQIMALFGSRDWEINSSRHLNYNNIHLFAGDYKFVTPESINLDKCTVVIINSDKPLKAIIVQCMGEISLTFEKPIIHGLKDNNRILEGKLSGKIRVVSKGDADEDNFCFETQDFEIEKDCIRTNAKVNFRYGRTQGVGTGMQIQLINQGLYGSKPKNNLQSTFISHKIENITLQKLQRLTIFPPDKKQKDNQNNISNLFNSPIELRCDGQFVFNALSKYAYFEHNVSLIQTVSNRASNSIRCQNLYLHFSSANQNAVDQKDKNSKQKSDSESLLNEWNLQLVRLVAVGKPVVLEAPEYETTIYANRLVANLFPLSFDIDSTNQQCEIHYKNHLISTQNLTYYVGKNGTLGTLECNCSGWISSKMGQNGKQIRARWSDRLRLEPDRKYTSESVVSVQGSAWLTMENNNTTEAAINADSFFFWLTQKKNASTADGIGELYLSRMQANNNVVLKSNPITAKVKKMQLWFEMSENKNQEATGADQIQKTSGENSQASQLLAAQNSQLAANNPYRVTGNSLMGKILIGQGQFQIEKLTLQDEIRVVQNAPSSDGKGKLELNGSLIQIYNLTRPSASASLFGEPAIIQYNNTMLTGSVINVSRGINRIWIESGGEALFMADNDEQQAANNDNQTSGSQLAVGKSLLASAPARIKWSKSMDFQNDTLVFNGNVLLSRDVQRAQCDSLSIILNKKVDFQNLGSAELQKSLDVNFVVLNNPVELKNPTIENGVIVAEDTLETSKLTIDMRNQTFIAEGPGKAITQRKSAGAGKQLAPQLRLTSNDSGTNLDASQNPDSQLINLSVDFQKRLEGSFDTRTLQTFTFTGYVKAIYSPIDKIGTEINTFSSSVQKPEAFMLKCDQMEIQTDVNKLSKSETSESGSEKGSSSHRTDNSAFIASGGVNLVGLVYNANADRITFEAKNGIITLEGDGQVPAQLFYQKVRGGQYNQASSSVIHYNTQTGAVRGEGIQDFSLFLSPKN